MAVAIRILHGRFPDFGPFRDPAKGAINPPSIHLPALQRQIFALFGHLKWIAGAIGHPSRIFKQQKWMGNTLLSGGDDCPQGGHRDPLAFTKAAPLTRGLPLEAVLLRQRGIPQPFLPLQVAA
jgi:hypothetical protein